MATERTETMRTTVTLPYDMAMRIFRYLPPRQGSGRDNPPSFIRRAVAERLDLVDRCVEALLHPEEHSKALVSRARKLLAEEPMLQRLIKEKTGRKL